MVPGDLCRLYKNTGTDASPTWVEIEKVKDLSFPITVGEGNASGRDCSWELSEAALLKVEVTFGYQYDAGADTIYDALVADMVGRTKRIYAIADGDIATDDTRYLKLPAQIFGMDNDEPLDGGKVAGFKLKPTRFYETATIVPPAFVTVSS